MTIHSHPLARDSFPKQLSNLGFHRLRFDWVARRIHACTLWSFITPFFFINSIPYRICSVAALRPDRIFCTSRLMRVHHRGIAGLRKVTSLFEGSGEGNFWWQAVGPSWKSCWQQYELAPLLGWSQAGHRPSREAPGSSSRASAHKAWEQLLMPNARIIQTEILIQGRVKPTRHIFQLSWKPLHNFSPRLE